MDQKKTGGKLRRLLRFLFGLVFFLTVVSLLGEAAAWIVCHMGGISFPVHNASGIGIIDGADGPTAVFITSSVSPAWKIIVKLLLLAGTYLGWLQFKNRR